KQRRDHANCGNDLRNRTDRFQIHARRLPNESGCDDVDLLWRGTRCRAPKIMGRDGARPSSCYRGNGCSDFAKAYAATVPTAEFSASSFGTILSSVSAAV